MFSLRGLAGLPPMHEAQCRGGQDPSGARSTGPSVVSALLVVINVPSAGALSKKSLRAFGWSGP